MKLPLLVGLLFLFGCKNTSPKEEEIVKKLPFTAQELQLLQSDMPAEATYDFSLDQEEQFRSIALQVDRDICSGRAIISTAFHFTDHESLDLMLWYDHLCPNHSYNLPPNCFPPIDITVNCKSKNEILLNYQVVNFDELIDSTVIELKNNHELIKRGDIIFTIKWDHLKSEEKQDILIELMKAYIHYSDTAAQEIFQKSLNELDDNQIKELKTKTHFVFQMLDSDVLPPPPPSIIEIIPLEDELTIN
ncbi:hypothetical protein SAMN05216480_103163 [Pustulibacterium marinum]|uniref:Uncharacterized protein n=1 Tax=Pustulibacterium marinum TaxID=1224947 RepID=A0A1I7G4Q5_9FLAO|nr:hypothetical protein [Pustulibacterium marinum]SFU43331.1 hypothetical protein SAMN05216480_103163 [Pustulibacterium marinum]